MKLTDQSVYDYFFEDVGRGVIRGANDPRGEHFTGMRLSNSIVRELIQNSLDAQSKDSDVVIVRFDLATIPTWDIPGIETLLSAANLAADQSDGYQGADALETAVEALSKDTMTVLKVSDYGTTGLLGTEIDDNKSALTALVRGEGLSTDDSGRGGSFGIGSSVGFVASSARTVAYITLREDDPDGVLFASSCRLASFIDHDNIRRDGTGIYTKVSRADSLEFPRGVDSFSKFEQRTSPGTDVFIYGYKNATKDPDLHQIRDCVIDNFLAAIYYGRLVVVGEGHRGEWTLDKESIAHYAMINPVHRAYYLAISEGDVIHGNLKKVGDVRLHVAVDPAQTKPLPVVMMRSPLMRIGTYRPSIQLNYSAIFICDDPKGNELLRNIEPPAHDRWNTQGPRSDAGAVKEIREFIKQEISALFAGRIGQTTTIKGLEQHLPLQKPESPAGTPNLGSILGTTPKETDPGSSETPVLLGSEVPIPTRPRDAKSFTASVSRPAIARPDGPHQGTRGEHSDNSFDSKVPSKKKTIPTNVESGDGKSRFNAIQLSIRSYQKAGDTSTVLIVRGDRERVGSLPLIGIGGDGAEFDLRVHSASMEVDGSYVPLTVNTNELLDVPVSDKTPTRLLVKFGNLGRYRIGVASDT